MHEKKVALTLGWLFVVIHAIWSLAVAIVPKSLQSFVDWIFALHHINLPISIMPFNFGHAIIFLIVTFIYGYILGWIFAKLWNKFAKK